MANIRIIFIFTTLNEISGIRLDFFYIQQIGIRPNSKNCYPVHPYKNHHCGGGGGRSMLKHIFYTLLQSLFLQNPLAHYRIGKYSQKVQSESGFFISAIYHS